MTLGEETGSPEAIRVVRRLHHRAATVSGRGEREPEQHLACECGESLRYWSSIFSTMLPLYQTSQRLSHNGKARYRERRTPRSADDFNRINMI